MSNTKLTQFLNFLGGFSVTKIASVIMIVTITVAFIVSLIPESKLPKHAPISNEQLQTLLKDFVVDRRNELEKLPSQELELAKFGKKLFFDAKFSANGQISCHSCHIQHLDFTDGKKVAEGIGKTHRNTPTIINSRFNYWFFWDGRADSLAAQALAPIEHPMEHGISRTQVVNILRDHYKDIYEQHFGQWPKILNESLNPQARIDAHGFQISDEMAIYALQTISNAEVIQKIVSDGQKNKLPPSAELKKLIYFSEEKVNFDNPWLQYSVDQQNAINQVFANFGLAIAAYEKAIIAIDSPFDQFLQKFLEGKATNPESAFNSGFNRNEFEGLKIFAGEGGCALCHSGANFTDQQFHNIGLASNKSLSELAMGRAKGVIDVMNNPFNCDGSYLSSLKSNQPLESCLELPWLQTESLELVGAFKTPSLRNVMNTAPYFHDGRAQNLDEVLSHYNLLKDIPAMGHRAEVLLPLELSDEKLEQLKLFLKALTSPVVDLTEK